MTEAAILEILKTVVTVLSTLALAYFAGMFKSRDVKTVAGADLEKERLSLASEAATTAAAAIVLHDKDLWDRSNAQAIQCQEQLKFQQDQIGKLQTMIYELQDRGSTRDSRVTGFESEVAELRRQLNATTVVIDRIRGLLDTGGQILKQADSVLPTTEEKKKGE